MQLAFRRSLFALGALSLALAPLSSTVQAQPRPASRPSSPRAGAQNGRFAGLDMLQGTVTRRRDNNEFDVRVGGATFRVRSTSLVALQSGDRVTLRGTFQSNAVFQAQSVRVAGANASGAGYYGDDTSYGDFGNGGYGNDTPNGVYDTNGPSDYLGNVDFPATVTRLISAREVEVRGDNGRLYRVASLDNVSFLREGARLRVRGEASGTSLIINARVLSSTGVGTGNYGGNGNYGGTNGGNGGSYGTGTTSRPVDFPGRVLRLDSNRNEATVRGDNGRDYIVRGAQVDEYQTGDRVRVRGQADGNVIELDHLDLVL